MSNQKILNVAMFATLFIVVSWIAPAMYVTYAPPSEFVEVHDFDVQDTYSDADDHIICFNRTVHRASNAKIQVELSFFDESGAVIEEDSFTVDAYFQKGQETVIIPREVRRESLSPGQYKYTHSVKLTYANGRVERVVNFDSERFTVYENKSQVESDLKTC